MVDNQLLSAGEQLAQILLTVRTLKHVFLFDPHPGQFAPLAAQLIPQPREFFFLGEQPFAILDPLIPRDDTVALHFQISFAQSLFGGGCSLSASAAASRSNCSCQYLL